jgi:hypothetical protein
MVVKVAGRNEIQVTHNGQAQLLSVPYTPPAWPVPETRAAATLGRMWPHHRPGSRPGF